MTDFTRRSALGAAAAAVAAPLLPSMQAVAAAPPVAKQAPGIYRYKVGDIRGHSRNGWYPHGAAPGHLGQKRQ